ncbi:MAG: DNA-binding response regulator [Roseibacillus sp.]|jgi:DNA-binding response OmpR family regulator|nr:DNA-binding response regulator [Roseibacillus sp.]MCP4729339.1 response regulator transcription factor [Roseibacillus sp.]MDP7307269.1 response regulator transcription factor [Roseibacillus sp.]MDP7654694.1 response regulator transcription factor [Roseibacillus sp.]HJM63023.1 response regulator transcription factor [Roseibacillus sp.]|tara:strand:+ start:19948 stop:20628 length:681 start_codon:yes stop_codon:yes gene_type:complete
MDAPTILVVEDDAAVRQGVVDALTFSGYEVLSEADGKAGCDTALRATYQLLLLDLVLPGYSGFEILEAIKKERPGQPVIILSARGEENDRVRGLKMGADDYIVKPFSVRELLARVDAVLRRSTERPSVVETHQINGGEVDFARREIRFEDGDREELSERESELLRYLVAQSGRAVPRDELLRQVWGLDPKNIETRTVDMHVAHLRQKLRCQNAVVTVRGKGYMIGS